MVDAGQLGYDKKVAEYWPQFGDNGKEAVTVADLMRHEAGLANFDTSIAVEDTSLDNIRKNR